MSEATAAATTAANREDKDSTQPSRLRLPGSIRPKFSAAPSAKQMEVLPERNRDAIPWATRPWTSVKKHASSNNLRKNSAHNQS